jgi:uncharacterized protein YraI
MSATLPAAAETQSNTTTAIRVSSAPSAKVQVKVTTAPLNLRRGPGRSYGVRKVIARGTRVSLTGRSARGFAEIIVGSSRGWVSTRYLASSAPRTRASGYAVEKRLTANTIRVHRAARRAFPWVRTYHGYRNDPGSDHYRGRGLDLMIPNYRSAAGRARGNQVANWARRNHRQLRIQYIIWNQHIWNVSRAREGWRPMRSRGSDSANHKNHVHISVR